MNKMYAYLKEHAYVSENKHSNYQFELSEERAECIANKYDSLTDELQQENKKLNGAIQTYNILLKSNAEENKQLLEIVNDLSKENKILKENAENNDKVVDKVNWENQLLKKENKQLKEEKRKVRDYINKHCVNEKISKEVGYKCYTMADTNELEKIMKILGDK